MATYTLISKSDEKFDVSRSSILKYSKRVAKHIESNPESKSMHVDVKSEHLQPVIESMKIFESVADGKIKSPPLIINSENMAIPTDHMPLQYYDWIMTFTSKIQLEMMQCASLLEMTQLRDAIGVVIACVIHNSHHDRDKIKECLKLYSIETEEEKKQMETKNNDNDEDDDN
jgi:hypothetical protein